MDKPTVCRTVAAAVFTAALFALTGCEDDSSQASSQASDYGVTDPSSAAVVVVDDCLPFYVTGVTVENRTTGAVQSLGTVPDGGQRAFRVAPGSYTVSVRYHEDIAPIEQGSKQKYWVTDTATVSIDVAAGEAAVCALHGGASGSTTYVPAALDLR